MAFQPIKEDKASNQFDDLPWVNEFLSNNKKQQDGTIHLVVAIKETPKGFVLATEQFLCWVWRKSNVGSQLISILKDSTEAEVYPSPQVMLKSSVKDKYIFGLDDEAFVEYERQDESIVAINPSQQINLPLNKPPSESNAGSGSNSKKAQAAS